MSQSSVIFFGTPDFAVPSLEALAVHDAFDVQAVITQPDKPVGRKKILTPSPVKLCAEKHGIPVFQPENINTEFSRIPNTEYRTPDFFIVIAYGQLLSQEVLDIPKRMPINIHASLLPRWRGASPIQHAILAGDTVTGVTIQRMVSQLDAGPILSQQHIDIDPRETFESLHDRLKELSTSLVIETLAHPLQESPQDESQITTCKKLSRVDGHCDPLIMTAEDIDRHVRALNPWPSVTCNIKGSTLKIIETSLKEKSNSISLKCADNSILYLATVKPIGKRHMTGQEWKRGIENKTT